ncbi:MAG: hypothetical protein IPL11_13965 [Candidatus Accumulibacter sp.]|nr:hypothetical protein [Accumulibacter sp.]
MDYNAMALYPCRNPGSARCRFPERLFTYNHRLYDRYRCPFASLAILADDTEHWKPARYGYQLFGCKVGIRFPIIKNPGLCQPDRSPAGRCQYLRPGHCYPLVHTQDKGRSRTALCGEMGDWHGALYERHWDRQRIIDLFSVIDWLMRLPAELEQRLL